MEITDRMSKMGEQLHQRRLEGKLEDAEQEKQRLEVEARMLRDERQEDRSDFSKLLSALEDSHSPASPRRHLVRRVMTLTIAAGGAYVLGAKAGRERYEQIRGRWDRWMHAGRATAADIRGRADDAVEDAKVVTDRAADATALVGETAQAIVEGPSDARSA